MVYSAGHFVGAFGGFGEIHAFAKNAGLPFQNKHSAVWGRLGLRYDLLDGIKPFSADDKSTIVQRMKLNTPDVWRVCVASDFQVSCLLALNVLSEESVDSFEVEATLVGVVTVPEPLNSIGRRYIGTLVDVAGAFGFNGFVLFYRDGFA